MVIRRKRPSIKTKAILNIKHKEELDFINNTFEEVITDSKNSIRIDFINGKSYLEERFLKSNYENDKIYLEFFDFISDDIMEYLIDDNSNFRATDSEGTIVRPSIEDYNYVINNKKQKRKKKI